MLEQPNYLEIPMPDLPSSGLMYPKNAKVEGRFLNVGDVKFLSLLTPENASDIINALLRRCFRFTNLNLDSLLLCDRTYLIFWLRANSYTQDGGYKINIKECSHCGKQFVSQMYIDELKTLHLKERPSTVILPHAQRRLEIKMPRVEDLRITDEDKDLELVCRMVNAGTQDPKNLIMQLDANDYVFLLDYCKQFKAGFDMNVELECPHCHGTHTVELQLTEDSLFAAHELKDIIRMTTLITKHTNVQIPDYMPWPELEILHDITDDIIKEENEENAKAEAKAKAKASSQAAAHGVHI